MPLRSVELKPISLPSWLQPLNALRLLPPAVSCVSRPSLSVWIWKNSSPPLSLVTTSTSPVGDQLPPIGSTSKLIWRRMPIGMATLCNWATLPKRVEISIERSAAFQPPNPALRDSM